MNAHDRLSLWLIGLIAVLGVVVVNSTAGAQDGPRLRDQMRDRNKARAEKQAEVRRQPDVTVVEPEFISAEELAKLPEITIYSEQSNAAGNVASGTAIAWVYKQAVSDEPYGYYTNLQPTTGYDPDPDDNPLQYEGAFFAEDMTLGNRFRPGIDAISGYSFRFYRSRWDPDPDHLATVHMELWDGDPLGLFDVAEDGYSNAPIAGTEADFVDIPWDYRFTAVANLPSPVVIPNERVWLVITSDACRLGFMNGGVPPTIGGSIEGWIMQEDDDGSFNGLGVCCHDGTACDVDGPANNGVGAVFCDDDEDGSRHFCSDGYAEAAAFAAFSMPTYFNATAWVLTDTTISLVPVGASGDHSITDNQIALLGGDQLVELEVQLRGWDPDLDGWPLLKTCQATLDSSGYTSGLLGTLTPHGPACTPPDPPDDPDMCESLLGPGATCNVPPAPATPTHCTPGFQDTSRTDWIFTMCVGTGTVEAVLMSTLDYRYGGHCTPPWGIDERYFGGAPAYGGTLVLEVPADAKGTFTVDLLPYPKSFMKDVSHSPSIPPLGLVPAKITVETGKCCYFDLQGNEKCIDNVTEYICETWAEVWAYVPNEECTGLPNECGCIGAPPPVASACCPDAGFGRSARHLSFTAGNAGHSQAIRVTFKDLPERFAQFEGMTMWAGEPSDVTELAGSAGAEPPPLFTAAPLNCSPVYRLWNELGVVHVYGEAIVPGATYEIQAISSHCDAANEDDFSAPLVVSTSAVWGDLVGEWTGTEWTPPDGSVDFVDIAALVNKFVNLWNAPIKARVDVAGDVPDRIIDFNDVAFVVDAFKGRPYPFDGPGGCP